MCCESGIRILTWIMDPDLGSIFCIFFVQYIYSYIHSPRVQCCFLITLRSVEGLPGVPSRDSNSGLPYSKPTHNYLSCAALWNVKKTLVFTEFFKIEGQFLHQPAVLGIWIRRIREFRPPGSG